MSAANDYAAGGEAGYTGSYVDTGTAWGISEGDAAEWSKMTAFTAAPQQAEAAPWWANMVGYGITKAIDNTFPNQNTGIQGNTKPGSFAGQNGRTYNQVGGVNAAPTVAGLVSRVQHMSPLTLGLLAVGAFFLLRR